jgi:hypothetical protein
MRLLVLCAFNHIFLNCYRSNLNYFFANELMEDATFVSNRKNVI